MKQKITNATIGFPLGHSLGELWYPEVYKKIGASAKLIKDEGKNILELVEHIRSNPYELTAVTIPHKESIIDLLDIVDKEANEMGAVNTVINKNGILKGYNTDVCGVEYALREVNLKEKNVLVVGAGGAARAIMYVLKKKASNITCINRTREKAEKLCKEFGGKVVNFEKINPEAVDLIINTTPIGMSPNIDISSVPRDFLRSKHTVFDIVYNPIETRLLQEAKRIGAKIISGLDMYIAQGLRQIELWQGINIEDVYYVEMKKFLTNRLNFNI